MSRIAIPASIEAAPDASRPLLEQVRAQLGSVPNLFRLAARSPAALEGYLGLSGALGKGRLPLATRERIALAIAEFNGCGYCLSAHGYLAANLAKLPPEEIAASRLGRSADARAAAAVAFALKVAEGRGQVADADLEALRAAGHDDGIAVEIVAQVALNVLTNYLNEVARTEIDFPLAEGVAA
ncbi:carboxymuconolactone decarboxylase family protein [Poseidonocella sp. HB161398]|uniref:carboxymuconolactone decarboxylase family protein n=1 Tax=Poseidonocella sp. HB161398 TaxID=2320855 RepID=UPI001107EEFE|nr:carboxymuconolactone decarboxylase family protein [Poseidonocella sp. HB161398]